MTRIITLQGCRPPQDQYLVLYQWPADALLQGFAHELTSRLNQDRETREVSVSFANIPARFQATFHAAPGAKADFFYGEGACMEEAEAEAWKKYQARLAPPDPPGGAP